MKSKSMSFKLSIYLMFKSVNDNQFVMRSSVLWDGFSRAASSCFSRAFKSREFEDVTLISEDCHEFGAHRVILASASEKFRKILQFKSEERNPLIFLRGLASQQVMSLLHFIYDGKVNVETEDLATFINIVTEFEIDGLKFASTGDNLTDDDLGNSIEQQIEYKDTFMTDEDHDEEEIMNIEGEIKDISEEKALKEEEELSVPVSPPPTFSSTNSSKSYFENSDFLESSERQYDGLHHCMKCDYKTKRKELLRTHMSSSHDGPKIVCPNQLCSRVYSSKANLRSHMKSCHNCDKCQETFDYNNELKKHKRVAHNIF